MYPTKSTETRPTPKQIKGRSSRMQQKEAGSVHRDPRGTEYTETNRRVLPGPRAGPSVQFRGMIPPVSKIEFDTTTRI